MAATIVLDSLPVERESISISPAISYQLDSTATRLFFSDTTGVDTVTVCYRKLSRAFYEPLFLRDVRYYERGAYVQRTTAAKAGIKGVREEELFDFGELNTFGAITRGVTFGNRQNVFVNSALNLQMDGQLSEDLRVSAVITDQNIPYQPEGNTQQLRDFDNVFIKLYNDKFQIQAGDIVLTNPAEESYFLKYYKNVQGLSLGYKSSLSNGWKSTSKVTGALAKGQFVSTTITPIEGVQGPYKLRGANNEQFVIILANSERIYVDGKLMERGFDRDYVIDYNLGEVTFSTNVLITRFSRIRVDYEYANQYYARSNVTALQSFSNDRTTAYVTYYREKDNPASTLGFELSDQDRDQLQAAGDGQGSAVISGVDSTGFIENAVLYRVVDTTLTSDESIQVYEFSTDEDQALYRVTFSNVGEGNGAYAFRRTTANGKVYEYVGENQGAYEPVQLVPTPNQRQMLVAGLNTKLGSYEHIGQEVAWSYRDQNLYSARDDEDNSGWAYRASLASAGRSVGFMQGYQLYAQLDFEFLNHHFTAIDRFRPVDYDRDWGYDVFQDSLTSRRDLLGRLAVKVQKKGGSHISYEAERRTRSEVIDGYGHKWSAHQTFGPLEFRSENYWMKNEPGIGVEKKWFRLSEQLQTKTWLVNPGYRFLLEQNTTAIADSIRQTVMHYYAHNGYLVSGDSSKVTFRADYTYRVDQLPQEGVMEHYTAAHNYSAQVAANAIPGQRLSGRITFRDVTELRGTDTRDQNLLGQIEWNGTLANKLISNSFMYATSNVRELQREYVFLQVATGEGTHTWRDENADGVQDLNEFYEAINADEKNYIKLFTPTDTYVSAFRSSYVHAVDVRAPAKWRSQSGVVGVMGRLSLRTNLKYDFKSTDSQLKTRLNPFGLDVQDTTVLSARNLIRNTLFFNRNAPGFAWDFSHSIQRQKNLLSGGFELIDREDLKLATRVSFGAALSLRAKGGIGQTVNQSDFLQSRNFQLQRYLWEGEVVWQPATSFRAIAGVGRRHKANQDAEEEAYSSIYDYKGEITWVQPGSGNLNVSFNWLAIAFEGVQNSYLGYELLEALQPGSNQRWQVNWQQTLRKGLQLTLQYHGRNSPSAVPVHTGSVQVTAYF
ncbi:hypothetical protein [Marinoscillum furvescens]|nr:hypothetical protein [Marinoscillum furvescens]